MRSDRDPAVVSIEPAIGFGLREGDIQFLDRADQQVKIHGHRVELGEIDSVLSGHPAVQHATTMVRESGGGDQRLATYVVLEDPAEIDLQNRNGRSRPAQVTEALQTWLRDQLPEHMVPPTITILERFPLTPSGKVDRRALPEPDESRGSADYVAPRTMQQKKLAQIWSDVLNVDRVGAGDDFFRLGGDSILSLQLVAAANNAGLQLTPRLVFEHRTLAELAAVVGSRPNVVAEQGPVVGEVPLTPIQLWFLEQQQPEPDHFNQATMLQLREDVSPQMCEEALAALLAHHDALRLRYAQESGQWRQHIVPPGGDVPLDVVDLSGSLTSEERANRFAQTTERLQASLSLTAGPLLRAALIKCGESEPQRLCIAIHHLAVDAVSWRILLEDFQLACQQLRAGNAVRLASKTMSFRDWSHRLHEFVNSETASEQLERWLEMPWPESSEIPCDHPGGANVAGGSQHVSVELSEADTRRLLQDVPSAYNTQINDVLLTALTLAFEGWTGHRSVLVDLEGHGRDGLPGDADVSRTVGWFTSLFPVVLRVDESDDPATALKSVKEQLRAVPPGGLSYGILRFLAGEESAERLARIPQPQVRFNYLGRFDQLHDERSMFDRADESAGPLTSPRHRRTHLLDITGRVMDGRLHLHWAYSPAVHEPETVERLAKRFVESLRQLIAHCVSKEAGGFTPSDFPAARIDQTQLDRLETQFGREQIEDLYALAPMQQGMMYHSRQSPSAGMYVQQVWLEASDLDEETLLEAWQRVTARHAALRTSFIQGGDSEAIQLVRRHVNVPVTHHDLGDLDGKQQTAWMEQYQDEDRRRGLDLSGLPMRLALIRRGPGRTDCLWTHHHVALDGWSKMRVLAEVFRQYDAGCRGEELAWPAPRPYREYIAWLQRQDLAAAESYWRDQLSDFVTPTVIGADRTQVDPDEPDHGECWFELPEETLDRLQALARSWGITLNTITLGACGLLLSRYSGEQDVVVGATVSGRPGDLPGVEEMVGVFINTLPVRHAGRDGLVAEDVAGGVAEATGGADGVRAHPALADPAVERGSGRCATVRDPLRLRELPGGSWRGGRMEESEDPHEAPSVEDGLSADV